MAISLNDNIETNSPKPSDSRYYNGLVPWADVASVNAGIDSAVRYKGLTVNIAGTEYWYSGGVLDTDLVVKSPALSAIDITFNGIKNLLSSSSLEPLAYYRITDWQTTGTIQGTSDTYTGEVEPLIVQAISNNVLGQDAKSELHYDDIIKFNLEDTSGSMSGDIIYDSGGSGNTGSFNLLSYGTTWFIIDSELVIDGTTDLLVRPGEGEGYYYSQSDYGTKRTQTDLGDGTFQIDILDPVIDLGVYCYVELYGNFVSGGIEGKIVYRKNQTKNIEKYYDFRNVKFRRFRGNAIGYSPLQTYNINSIVTYNDAMFICLKDGTVGVEPTYTSSNWIEIIKDNTVPQLSDITRSIAINSSNTKDFRCFSDIDSTTKEVTFSIDNVSNIIAAPQADGTLDNNVYCTIDGVGLHQDINYNAKVKGCTFFQETTGIDIAGGLERVVVGYDTVPYFFRNFSGSGNISDTFFNPRKIGPFSGRVMNNVINGQLRNCVFSRAFRDTNIVGGDFITAREIDDVIAKDMSGTIIAHSFKRSTCLGDFTNNLLYAAVFECSFLGDTEGNTFNESFSYNELGVGFSDNIFNIPASYNLMGPYFSGNSFSGTIMSYNSFGNNTYNNIVTAGSITNNSFDNDMHSNNISADMIRNIIGPSFNTNTISASFIANTTFTIFSNNVFSTAISNNLFKQLVNNISVDTVFQKNTIDTNLSLNSFSGGTHVAGNYPCDIIGRPDGEVRLKYIDNTDNINIVGITE